MGINLEISDEKAHEMLSESILKAIDSQSRERIIQTAIKYLITPNQDTYSSRKAISPLQAAFNSQMEYVLQAEARKIVEESGEIRDALQSLIHESITKTFVEKREILADSISKAIVRAFDPDYSK